MSRNLYKDGAVFAPFHLLIPLWYLILLPVLFVCTFSVHAESQLLEKKHFL